MFRTLHSLVASMFSLHHYYWAACVRRGVGLSYLFTISAMVVGGLYGFAIYSIGYEQLFALFNSSAEIPEMAKSILNLMPPEVLIFAALPLLLSLILSITLLNFALLVSIFIGQPVNYLYGERLDFDQVLRINSYVVVISTLIAVVAALIFPSLTDRVSAIGFGFIIFYNFYGILYQKIDL